MILFDLAFLNDKVSKLEAEQNREDFWNDQKSALKVIDEYNDVKEERDTYVHVEKAHKEIEELLFACTDSDEDMRSLIEDLITDLTAEVKKFRQKLLFKGEFDKLTLHLKSIVVLVVPNHKTGLICFHVCMFVGANVIT